MHQNPAITGFKRHVGAPDSDVLPVLGAHVSDAKFQYSDLIWKAPTGIMAYLVAKSGNSKG